MKNLNQNKVMMKKTGLIAGGLALVAALTTAFMQDGDKAAPGLKETVVLIIRHAEKPETGLELSPAGRQRAEAYPGYFKSFMVGGKPLKLEHIFATADSKNSHRPRLTTEPLGKALGLEVDNRFANKKFQDLVDELQTKDHGRQILICWHHGEIPKLVKALGADPGKLLPEGHWPDGVFNWVVELRYDGDGHLIAGEAKRINEKLMPGDGD
jgi:hypothetical protein